MRSPLAAILLFGAATASPHSLIAGAGLFASGLALEVGSRWPRLPKPDVGDGPRQP